MASFYKTICIHSSIAQELLNLALSLKKFTFDKGKNSISPRDATYFFFFKDEYHFFGPMGVGFATRNSIIGMDKSKIKSISNQQMIKLLKSF